jgi:sugar phosphate isomerase/epimerase
MTGPRFGICELSTPDATYLEDLEVYSAGGIGAISLSQLKLDPDNVEQEAQALRESGMTASAAIPTHFGILPPGKASLGRRGHGQPADPAFPGPSDLDTRVEVISDSIRSLAPFEPSTVIVLTGGRGERSASDARAIAVEGLREISRVAREVGVTLSLEVLRADYDNVLSIVHSLQEGVDLLDEVGDPVLGISYDVYHLWDAPEIMADTRKYAHRISAVQVSDWREPTRGPRDRIMPGDGVMALTELIAALEEGGYQGWYDLEVLSDDGRFGYPYPDSIWNLSNAEIVRRARTSFENVWPG